MLPESEGNDLQVHFVPLIPHDQAQAESNFGTKLDDTRPLRDLSKHPPYGVTILPSLILPRSSGRITLLSSDPKVYPNIEPGYFTDPLDMERAIVVSKFAAKVASGGPLGDVLGKPIVDPTIPDAYGTDEYFREYVKRSAITIYHPTSTCRMGNPSRDPKAVVDSKLRVIGIKNLRVADASVMPRIVSGNTNAPAIMIGERCADFIAAGHRDD